MIKNTTTYFENIKLELSTHILQYSEAQQDLFTYLGINNTKKIFIQKIINNLMSGRSGGKKEKAFNVFLEAITIIEKKYANPFKVILDAVIFSRPIMDVRYIKQGSIKVAKKIFLTQSRQISVAINQITKGVKKGSGNIEKRLASQIIGAYEKDNKSAAYGYKINVEKLAKAANR